MADSVEEVREPSEAGWPLRVTNLFRPAVGSGWVIPIVGYSQRTVLAAVPFAPTDERELHE
jgi:hypothetical protein